MILCSKYRFCIHAAISVQIIWNCEVLFPNKFSQTTVMRMTGTEQIAIYNFTEAFGHLGFQSAFFLLIPVIE